MTHRLYPTGTSIGRFLRFDRNAAMNADFAAAVAAIDRVHGVSDDLPEVPLINAGEVVDPERKLADAWFRFDSGVGRTVKPTSVAVRIDVPYRRFKTLHEIGHYLDASALPGEGFSSRFATELDEWRVAVGESRAFRDLVRSSRGASEEDRVQLQEACALDEVWARSYAQFVAVQCGEPALRVELVALRDHTLGTVYHPLQWTDSDFSRIAAAITALFGRLAWMV